MKLLSRIATVTLLAATGVSMVVGTAQAAPRATVPQATGHRATRHEVKFTMHITGFNRAVARRDGYAIRKNAAGQEYSVKVNGKGQAVRSAVTPAASVCGDGTISYTATGGLKATVQSSWKLLNGNTGLAFTWVIAVVDYDGVGSKTFAGGPVQQGGTPTSWKIPTGWVTTHSTTGSSYAEVTDGNILMASGAECDVPLPLVAYTTLY